jgi:Domain of unknown function (DUF4411)
MISAAWSALTNDGTIWVLDTSALIRFKQLIPVTDQWAAFKWLEGLVARGEIAMPRQVIAEAATIAHPDVPGVWASGVRKALLHPLEPDHQWIVHVMDVAGDVVDRQSDRDEADPWVCALSLQLSSSPQRVVVVTEDVVDRLPIKISMATACGRLGIAHCSAREFLDACGIPTRKEKTQADEG